jgi:transcriptional regulator of acetoin/glycerol metabolism
MMDMVHKRSTISITGERPAWAPTSDAPVVGLRVVGRDDVYPVPPRSFTIGTAEGHDVRLPDGTVSKDHCLCEWRARELWAVDLTSKNGTYVNGVKTKEARVVDGSVIVVGQTTLVAFAETSRSRRGRDEVVDGADPKYRIAVDLAIDGAMRGASVVLVGEPGTGRATVARAIHEIVTGPQLPFIHLRLGPEHAVEGASGLDAVAGTLFVEELGRLPQTLYRRVVALMSAGVTIEAHDRKARLQVVVSSVHRLWPRSTPDEIVQVALPPLRERGDDVLLLVDRFARAFLDTDRRAFTVDVLTAIRRYPWPRNLDELREAVERLAAIVKHGNVRDAAKALGTSKSALTDCRWSSVNA